MDKKFKKEKLTLEFPSENEPKKEPKKKPPPKKKVKKTKKEPKKNNSAKKSIDYFSVFKIWFKDNWENSQYFSKIIILLLMIIIQMIIFSSNEKTWFMDLYKNWINILNENLDISIIAIGMTVVIISGGIDLSVSSIFIAVCALLIYSKEAFLQTGKFSYIIAIILSLLFAILIGLCNGLLITKGKISPFIATLGIMIILENITKYFLQNYFQKVSTEFLNISYQGIIYWLIIAFIINIILQKTAFGRYVFAVGSNEKGAMLSGIDVEKVKIKVYMLMGLLVAISSIVQVSKYGFVNLSLEKSYGINAIACVLIGGTKIRGGSGTILGTILGTLIFIVFNNILNLIGVSLFLIEMCNIFIIIISLLMQKNERP